MVETELASFRTKKEDTQTAETQQAAQSEQTQTAEQTTQTQSAQTAEEEFTWGDLIGDGEIDDNEQEQTQQPEQTQQQSQTQAAETEQKQWWQTAAEKTGIEAVSEEDYIGKTTKPLFVRTDDDVLHNLGRLLEMTPEQRVSEKLRADGVPADLIAKRIKYLKDAGQFDVEDAILTRAVKGKISERTAEIKKQQSDSEQAQRAFFDNVNAFVSKTDKVFGMNVGKDDVARQQWQKATSKALTSGELGKLVNDRISKAAAGDAMPLLELFQFLKYGDKITVGFRNQGANAAKKEILDQLGNNTRNDQRQTYNAVNDEKKGDTSKGMTFRDK